MPLNNLVRGSPASNSGPYTRLQCSKEDMFIQRTLIGVPFAIRGVSKVFLEAPPSGL